MLEMRLTTTANDDDYKHKASQEMTEKIKAVSEVRDALAQGQTIENLDKDIEAEIRALDPDAIKLSFAVMEDGTILMRLQ